jgi:uncharacterized protein YbjT (DUF2867 family)
MGKIMVTGALGNVGGCAAKSLMEAGQSVVLADIDPEALKARFGEAADCVRFDFTDETTFESALDGVDRVFIMRPPHLGKPEDLKPFVDALQRKGGIRLVSFLSLLGVERNPMPPHHKIEKCIERAGLPYCHIRPSFFMQNLSGVHAFEIRHFDRIVVPVKKALTSFIDAGDVGALIAKVLSEPEKHANRGYSVTGPEAMGYREAARIFTEELGRKITYADPNPWAAQRYWVNIRGLEKGYATVMSMLYLMTRMGTAKRTTDIFEQVMGRAPRSFRQFVQANRAAWSR